MSTRHDAETAARVVVERIGRVPPIAVVLGSGLNSFVDSVEPRRELDCREIPGWPPIRVPGHAGRLVSGTLRDREILVVAGRAHPYEGHSLEVVTFGIRVLAVLGVHTLILTNASGGISPGLRTGSIVVIDDHMNLTGANPLVGAGPSHWGQRFIDMSEAYSGRLRKLARESAAAVGVAIQSGVYAAVFGPSYETPAEVRALRALGADLVGMSTVHETIVARQMGLEVLGLSTVTNAAAGLGPALKHDEVLAVGRTAGRELAKLVGELIARL